MTILDHRILIPKSPEKIWEFLSDLSQNSSWQVDCNSISFITSKHEGAGTRWRYSTSSGRSYVAEITAWYVGLGYEYTFVDGAPFKDCKGRIRLQEIAEGTVVQWTLTYETSGVLAGVRNAVGLKRQMETTMVDSLKNLWKVLQKVMPEEKPREVKSLMRDAPDYESRTNYRPRHPSSKHDAQTAQPPAEAGLSIFSEPPIAADDTRPRVPVRIEVPPVEPVSTVEPVSAVEPVSDSIEVVATDHDEEAAAPLLSEEAAGMSQADGLTEVPDPFTMVDKLTVPVEPKLDVTVDVQSTQEAVVVTAEAGQDDRAEDAAHAQVPPIERGSSSADTVKMATGEMSVFDLFGIPRPSQTQEMSRVELHPTVEAVLNTVPPLTPAPARIGLRLVLRRKRVKIRRPS